jgi:hypothetical protein
MDKMELVEYPDLMWCENIYEKSPLNDRQKLFRYCTEARMNKLVAVEYKQTIYNGEPYGRLFPSNDSQCSYHQVNMFRSYLFGKTEFWCDIVNSHFGIYTYINSSLFGNEESFPFVYDYMNNRDKIIDSIFLSQICIDRYNHNNNDNKSKKDILKCLFESALYGESIDNWHMKFGITLSDYDQTARNKYYCMFRECKEITEKLVNNRKFEQLREDVKSEYKKDKKKINNYQILRIILENEENKIMTIAIKFLNTNIDFVNNFKITSYNQGSFQIKPNDGINDENTMLIQELLHQANINILSKLCYNVKFIIKPFSDIKEATYGYDKMERAICNFVEFPNELKLAEIANIITDGNIKCTKNNIYFYDGKRWVQTTVRFIHKKYDNVIFKFIQKKLRNRLENADYKRICKTIGSSSFINSCINSTLDLNYEDNINFDDTGYLLNFTNGTYNFITKKLQNHNKCDLISKIINNDLNIDQMTKQTCDSFINLISDWFNDKDDQVLYTKYLLQSISYSLNSESNTQKAIMLMSCVQKNGKASFNRLLRSTFNSYSTNLPISYFIDTERDAESPKPILLRIKGCRLIFVDGMETSKKHILHSNCFKMITDRDVHIMRDLYGGSNDVFSFIPQGTIVMSSNEPIKFGIRVGY